MSKKTDVEEAERSIDSYLDKIDRLNKETEKHLKETERLNKETEKARRDTKTAYIIAGTIVACAVLFDKSRGK